jgi:hypothetical protein
MAASARLRVVVAGAGVAGLETLMALRALAGARVELTLIAPQDEFVYRPLAVEEPFASGVPGGSPSMTRRATPTPPTSPGPSRQ